MPLTAKAIKEQLEAEGVTVTEERLAMLLEYLALGGMVERDQWKRYRQVRRVKW